MLKYLLLVICLSINTQVFSQKGKSLSIVFIGNSITQGALLDNPIQEAPPVLTSAKLEFSKLFKSVQFSNQGVSGNTTVDFLPCTNKDFKKIVSIATELSKDKNSLLIFSIMLGTNDSAISGPTGSPISNKQYATNLRAIIDELAYLFPNAKFVINKPLWYSPNTYNYGMYLEAGLKRLESYTAEIMSIIDLYSKRRPNYVFLGDILAFEYFKNNYIELFTPEKGNAGVFYLHPNKKGAEKLSQFWSDAIINASKYF